MSLGEAAAKLVGIPSLLEPLAGSATVVPVPLDFIRQHLIDLEARHGTNLELALAQASKVRATSFRALRSPSQSPLRSEEHTSELQSLMRISYAVFCLKKKTQTKNTHIHTSTYINKNNKSSDTRTQRTHN